MLVNASINCYTEAAKNLTDEQILTLKMIFPNAEKSLGGYLSGTDGLVEFESLQAVINGLGITAEIKPLEGGYFVAQRNDLFKRIKSLEVESKLLREKLGEDGTLMQIHLPNFSLLSINEVLILEDECTDDLQGALDKGFKIICVCPPYSERRPTYILGRYNAERNPERDGKGALRDWKYAR